MAKKKKKEKEENDEFNDLEDEEFEAVYPTLGKPDKSIGDEVITEGEVTELEEETEEELGIGIIEEPKAEDYKYVKPQINKGESENDYEIIVKGQSHGFCNILVKHLLALEGVNAAAYKSTGIEPAKVFIRLENEFKIKKVIFKAIEILRERVVEVKEQFQKLKLIS